MANTTTVVDMRKFVEARDGKAFTTTHQVATAFEKLHNHVLAKVRALDCSDQFLTDNFSSVQFEHRGNTYEAFEMTKDGFMFLVMGFTGAKAAAIKEGYIFAFNEMAKRLSLKPDVLVGDLVGAVIGSSGEVVLDRVIDQKAAALPVALRRSFKHTMKSRLRTRFNVQKTALIPAEELPNACNFVAAYALEGELLTKREQVEIVGGPQKRYLVAFNNKGEQTVEEIPHDAYVLSQHELMEGMVATPGDVPVSVPDMFNFLMAAVVNLKSRYEHMTRRTGK
ncbi:MULTISPECIES: Rha family transcriptional regulator [unclassified Pseudomonas]|uniref:Rha family transcriptional regulator n=1 Tax=unclassified Pseudomonas TaxID=196821 RepID=UPI0021BB4128|nr:MULTISPECIES: Rha family transcriptional regulator [unclassified Pseudomonas]MCT8165624.1 Rha family transcriptional regulator [Pseudomonas sp. HD6422]MCT8183626.1 Rha family transcriptional regulator [Pseudomonas sp. HD6421]